MKRFYTWTCGSTIFLGAFLLFQIQPILAKRILPWFGGSASVWTTCLLFFQVALFFGYGYAHLVTRYLSPKRQAVLHSSALAFSLLALPVLPSATWKPTGTENPLPLILLLLSACIGLPFFLLSSTSPLVQSWYAGVTSGKLPYRYFALSNLASLVALLGYPVFVERWFSVQTQGLLWSVLYVAYVALCITCAVLSARAPRKQEAAADRAIAPSLQSGLVWMTLACTASLLSISVTNHLSQNVAAIPFLWVLPLGIYLLTFLLCFESDRWYRRAWALPVHASALAGMAYLIFRQTPQTSVRLVVLALSAGLFACCMFCHGELARRKPAPRFLTQYYLMISAGGAIGGLLVGLGAPLFLRGNWEFPIALTACALVTLFLEYRRSLVSDIGFTAVAVGVLVVTMMLIRSTGQTAVLAERSFYGALRIIDQDGARLMAHGTISHGSQYLDSARRTMPTTYYAKGTGVDLALSQLQDRTRRVGVIGLGAGTLAAYGRAGESFRFYELNPQVADLARSHFTFLSDSAAKTDIVLGDGRISLEREQGSRYDLLVVDAFSGDSIPVHLLSREALDVYFRHIATNGLLAMHVSNTALHIAPVVEAAAASLKLPSVTIHTPPDPSRNAAEAEWVIVARNAALLPAGTSTGSSEPSAQVWTDDYSALISILR